MDEQRGNELWRLFGLMAVLAAVLVFALCGCSTLPPEPVTPPPIPEDPINKPPDVDALDGNVVVDPPAEIESTRGSNGSASVHIGLRYVDPASNSGWDGDCPGADLDAERFYKACTAVGAEAWLLLNEAATKDNVRDCVLHAGSLVAPGRWLFISDSGHGGQKPDDNGDELDGKDETIILWDGAVRDDWFLAEIINQLPTNIFVVLWSDRCHSEGNFRAVRSAARWVQQQLSFGAWGTLPALTIVDRSATWPGAFVQMAASEEHASAFGRENGGEWSRNGVFTPRIGKSWVEWYDASKAKMPANQVPQWVEAFGVTDEFRNGPALQ